MKRAPARRICGAPPLCAAWQVQGARYKIFRNIGHAFFQMRQFVDAVEAYENVLVNDGQNLDYITGARGVLFCVSDMFREFSCCFNEL